MGRSPMFSLSRAACPLMCSVRYQRPPSPLPQLPARLLRLGAFAHTSHSTRGNATEQAERARAPCKTGITKKVTGDE